MIKTTWMTQGSFLFQSKKTRMLIDPYMSDFLERNHGLTRLVDFPMELEDLRPDWLVCTHDHLDHLDPQTIVDIASHYPECNFVGPKSCITHFHKLGLNPDRCFLLAKGDSLVCGDFTITAVPAFHSDPEAIGLLIAAEGRNIYLSGDSNYSEELLNDATRKADTVMICINGRMGNMSDSEALGLVKALKPQLALPMHYGLFKENTADPSMFIEGCKTSGINSYAMSSGKEISL
ncbi:MAG: MBL fold metallo-hydrolase [Planctomycetes bacterium]|nr:MBL fold metallo-hydrolase [Planctomycetota bacterium]